MLDQKTIKLIIGAEYIHGSFDHENDEYMRKAYREINEINMELFNKIPFPVIFTKNDPYSSAKEMRKRVMEEKKIYIFTGSSEHEFLTPKENAISRAVHDVYAHLVCGCPFSFQGEYNAYLEQRKYYPGHLWHVLFAEIPGQTSAFYFTGSFDYKQRAIEAPAHWLDLCQGLKKDYSHNSVLSFEQKSYKGSL